MNIETLRRMRSNGLQKITQEMDKISNPSASYTDDRIWKLEPDKTGNATATIRFLPATIKVIDGVEKCDDLPWVKIYSHGFQLPSGRWLITNCPTTIGEKCPICAENSAMWSTGDDDQKKIVRERKRKIRYQANVLIISDPKHPENEGQVKIFSFGAKIFDKIMDKMNPTFEDEAPVNVFDFWEGADFKLRQRKVEGYPNFDQSYFLEPSALGDDNYIMKVASQQHLLSEFIDPKNFKSFSELQAKMVELEGKSIPEPVKQVTQTRVVERDYQEPIRHQTSSVDNLSETSIEGDDEDDALAYFRRIAEAD